jgi:hypothetical protein
MDVPRFHGLRRRRQQIPAMLAVASLALGGVAIATAPASGASTKVPPLDTMLCANMLGSGFHKPIDHVILENAIQPVPFAPSVTHRTFGCNPISFRYGAAHHQTTTWSQVPNDHPLCWGLSYAWKAYNVDIKNAFGESVMSTGDPTSLCLPSWASTTGPVRPSSPAPEGLDYFTCYPLTAIAGDAGFTVPKVVAVQSQRHTKFVAVMAHSASRLCVPTTFIDDNQQTNPQSTNDRSMTCFGAKTTAKLAPKYWEQNAFGAGISRPEKTTSLCIPSTIVLEGPSSTSAAT